MKKTKSIEVTATLHTDGIFLSKRSFERLKKRLAVHELTLELVEPRR